MSTSPALLSLGKTFWLRCLACVAFGSGLIAQAQIVFTINATPTSDSLGYVTTQNYNFAFTLNTAPSTGNGSFQPGTATADDHYNWIQEWTVDPQIWTNVAGDGLGGTWTEPNNGDFPFSAAPFSYLTAAVGSPALTLYAGTDNVGEAPVGLTADGGAVIWIRFQGSFTGLTFSNVGETLPDPNVYLASYASALYAAEEGTFGWVHTTDGDAFFTINSVAVASTAPIPEPATYAALAGAAMLGLAVWRRRKRA